MLDNVRPLVINTENSSMVFEGTEVSNFHKGLDIFVYNNKNGTVLFDPTKAVSTITFR